MSVLERGETSEMKLHALHNVDRRQRKPDAAHMWWSLGYIGFENRRAGLRGVGSLLTASVYW